jgi:phosphopantetheinyl transferase (holo-ACP synthase)
VSTTLVTGCDVVDVDRLARALARTPALRDRVFTAGEQAAAVRGGVDPDGRR